MLIVWLVGWLVVSGPCSQCKMVHALWCAVLLAVVACVWAATMVPQLHQPGLRLSLGFELILLAVCAAMPASTCPFHLRVCLCPCADCVWCP